MTHNYCCQHSSSNTRQICSNLILFSHIDRWKKNLLSRSDALTRTSLWPSCWLGCTSPCCLFVVRNEDKFQYFPCLHNLSVTFQTVSSFSTYKLLGYRFPESGVLLFKAVFASFLPSPWKHRCYRPIRGNGTAVSAQCLWSTFGIKLLKHAYLMKLA